MYGAYRTLNSIDRFNSLSYNMLIKLLSSILISITPSALLASNPLNLGLWILLVALLFSFSLIIIYSTWFSLILFLIYIGGILVIFSYFIALTPNLYLRIKPLIIFSTLIFFIRLLIIRFFNPSIQFHQDLSSYSSIDVLYLSYNVIILVFIRIILLFIIIAVVKITSSPKGPLRPFF